MAATEMGLSCHVARRQAELAGSTEVPQHGHEQLSEGSLPAQAGARLPEGSA